MDNKATEESNNKDRVKEESNQNLTGQVLKEESNQNLTGQVLNEEANKKLNEVLNEKAQVVKDLVGVLLVERC